MIVKDTLLTTLRIMTRDRKDPMKPGLMEIGHIEAQRKKRERQFVKIYALS